MKKKQTPNHATPRSWTTVARKLFQQPTAAFPTIAGKIGKGMASELMAFRDLAARTKRKIEKEQK